MIFKYTKKELEEAQAIEDKFNALFSSIDLDLKKQKQGSKAYADILEKRDTLENDYMSALADFYSAAEKRHFKAVCKTPDAALIEAKKQIPKIIEHYINNDLIIHNTKTGAVEKKADIAGAYLTTRQARAILYRELHLFTDFLKNDKEKQAALNDYISEYISICIYIDKKQDKTAISQEQRKEPLSIIKTYGLLNDKVTQTIISGELTQQKLDGQISYWFNTNQATKKKHEVIVKGALLFTGTQTKLTKRLSAFDNAVHNAITTAFYYHKRSNSETPFYITPQEVWRTMNGTQDAKKNPSKAQIEKVCASLDKMRFTRIFLDISDELEKHKLNINDERLKAGAIDTYLIKSDKVIFETEKGKYLTGYRIDAEPILYTYSAAKDHVLFVPFALLDTTQTTGNEGNTIEIRGYLLQQIELMYNGQRNSHRILFETLYKNIGLEPPEKRVNPAAHKTENAAKTKIKSEAKKDREKVLAILEAWKQKKYIKSFMAIKKGHSFIGVDIDLFNQKPII